MSDLDAENRKLFKWAQVNVSLFYGYNSHNTSEIIDQGTKNLSFNNYWNLDFERPNKNVLYKSLLSQ